MAGLAFPATPLAALTLDRPDAIIGQWDLSLDGSNKACRLTLRGEQVHGGYYVGMPAGCRRALPALANVIAWGLSGDDRLNLADVYGGPLLIFILEEGGVLVADGPQGETYRLRFAEGLPAAGNAPSELRGAVVPDQAPVAPRVVAPPQPSVRPTDVAGRYAVLREGGRDTGCMVTLDAASKAFLAPACRDQGIVIFDPTAWRIIGGRLVLTARKGHTAQLDLQADGTWLKDPKDGKSLSLKKF